MAKLAKNWEQEYQDVLRSYKRIVAQFDQLLLCNAKLIDGVQKSVKILRDGGVPEQLMVESKLDEYTKRLNYSEVLKDGKA